MEWKKRQEIEGEVNIHRVKNVKKQFKDELEEKKVILRLLNLITQLSLSKHSYS